jgi:hypothetical protein
VDLEEKVKILHKWTKSRFEANESWLELLESELDELKNKVERYGKEDDRQLS